MTIFTSTARRREIGTALRRLRESRGYKGADLATRLGWTTTMLSRVETGKRETSPTEIASYTAMCGVAGEELQRLLALAAEQDAYRVKSHPGELPDSLRTLIFHESTAQTIECYESIFIPGLVQTEDYARALFHDLGISPEDIEPGVKNRIARRASLTKINPPQCVFYVHENALRSVVGGPQVMNDQLMRLLFVCDRPQCSIRVIPAETGARGLAHSSFQIFGYADEPAVVYVQNETTCEFLQDRDPLVAYRAVLNRLARVALTEAQSREFVAWMASEYEQQGAARHDDGPGLAEE